SFLRQDEVWCGGYLISAEQRFLYNADLAVEHTDDFHFQHALTEVPVLNDGNGGLKTFHDLPNADKMALQKVVFELEHRHSYGLPFWYFLSGDEHIKESYIDWGEFLQSRLIDDFYIRGLAWNIFNLVDLYRFTHDDT